MSGPAGYGPAGQEPVGTGPDHRDPHAPAPEQATTLPPAAEHASAESALDPAPGGLELGTGEWRRVSPRFLVSEFLQLGVGAVVLIAVAIVFLVLGWGLAVWGPAALLALVLVYAAFTPRRVRAIGFRLRDDDLVFRRGILFQRFVSVPYGRMQLIDITRGPLQRALGLSDLRFVTAAATTGVAIPGLAETDADDLRDHLVALAETRRAGL